MPIALRAIFVTLFLVLGTLGSRAEGASPWVQGLHSRVRLLSGGTVEGRLLAGVEIELDQGFKTYWRTPGESGLPPRFDWTGSQNASGFEVKWPAPKRIEDAGGVAFVYSRRVVLPVLLSAPDAGKPSQLVLALDYGVCKDICIPAHADLSLDLGSEGARASLKDALKRVPVAQALGAPQPLSIISIAPQKADKPTFIVETRAPGDTKPALFVEGPEDWYLAVGPSSQAGRFVVTVEERPKDTTGTASIRLTLVAGDESIETEVPLDAALLPR